MRCPRCQAENREGRRFCAQCGGSLATATTMYRAMDMGFWLEQAEG